jgi:uncharacterized protein YndB with AHSA1/START domain
MRRKTMETTHTTEAIRKTITVPRGPESAFRLFTEGMGSWWPVKAYSAGGEDAEAVNFEPRAGGRIYERQAGGAEVPWGTVETWEPPSLVRFSWGLNGSEIQVVFVPDGDGTRVELEHRGWDRLEDQQERDSYDAGWDIILAEFAATAGAA